MRLKALLSIVFITTGFFTYGQDGVRKCSETIYSLEFKYRPTEIVSLDLLPLDIQDSITTHLRGYLGDSFYNRLVFNSGLIIDYDELVKSDPNVRDYEWQVPTYDLCFYFSEKEAGIDLCCSPITFDRKGNVVNEIEFPKFQDDSLNTKFLDKKIILSVAENEGFSTDQYEIAFSDNNIVFRFEKKMEGDVECIEISVHTGRIIRKYNLDIIYD